MLSYQHGYHAGNLADLHKHTVLAALWSVLSAKPRALTYMDTHAGRGLYDLDGEQAQKTGEADAGIGAYKGGAAVYDAALADIRKTYGATTYAGSPALIASLARPDDRLILAEKHPAEHKALKAALGHRADIHHRDGFEMALALSPPNPRRGLVLIDPSYEVKTEYTETAAQARKILAKWPQAVVMVWYPVLEAGRHRDLVAGMKLQERLHLGATFKTESGLRMRGTGLVILNPPYGLRETLKGELAAIAPLYAKMETL